MVIILGRAWNVHVCIIQTKATKDTMMFIDACYVDVSEVGSEGK
jgi:hypothetical protein